MSILSRTYAWCLQRPEDIAGSPGTGLPDDCELPSGCWEPNPGPPQEQFLWIGAISPAPRKVYSNNSNA